MTSTIPTIHEELGRLRQADTLREARRCALARDAASASKRRRARRVARVLALPSWPGARRWPLLVGRSQG